MKDMSLAADGMEAQKQGRNGDCDEAAGWIWIT